MATNERRDCVEELETGGRIEKSTNVLRWLIRWDGAIGVHVLQQLWTFEITDNSGRALRGGEVWRDVPVVDDREAKP